MACAADQRLEANKFLIASKVVCNDVSLTHSLLVVIILFVPLDVDPSEKIALATKVNYMARV